MTLWEDIGTVEKFLPSIPVVSTTATIAAVATTSALLAKPLADLLLKVVKPIVKNPFNRITKGSSFVSVNKGKDHLFT